MKKIKLLSLILAVIMMLSAFVGCGDKDTDKSDEGKDTTQSGMNNDDSSAVSDVDPNKKLLDGFVAKKVGSVGNLKSFTTYNSVDAISYMGENGKYGIMSLDGKKDSGAIYTKIESVGSYFKVKSINKDYDLKDMSTMNCFGVVDKEGNEIIPQKYALIEQLSDRYFKVIEATKQTTDKNNYLLYYTSNMFSLGANSDDILFEGNWYIYDVISGKLFENATGTKGYRMSAYGNIIKYTTDSGVDVIVNEKGEEIPQGARIFNNGFYTISSDSFVYNSNNEQVFNYDKDGFIPVNNESEYILAQKYENNAYKYVLMDTTGKVVSAEFNSHPTVNGSFVWCDSKIYRLDGSLVIDGEYSYPYVDKATGKALLLTNDTGYTIITNDGEVIYQAEKDDSLYVYSSDFVVSKKSGTNYKYYSFKDKDFTIDGYFVGTWLVATLANDNLYDLVDTLSGKPIIKGYSSYQATTKNGCIYVYAKNKNNNFDIYTVR